MEHFNVDIYHDTQHFNDCFSELQLFEIIKSHYPNIESNESFIELILYSYLYSQYQSRFIEKIYNDIMKDKLLVENNESADYLYIKNIISLIINSNQFKEFKKSSTK